MTLTRLTHFQGVFAVREAEVAAKAGRAPHSFADGLFPQVRDFQGLEDFEDLT